MFDYGCRYCKMDMMRQEEYCELTDKLTKGEPKCDFAYEDCPEYQKAKAAKSKQKSKPEPKREPKLTQTSVFGAAGEKPFGVG